MVCTSPTKVSRVFELKGLGHTDSDIATRLGIHRTTVGRIFSDGDRKADPYYQKPKTGRPPKLTPREVRTAARMLAKTEVANATELQKREMPHVSRHTIARGLKQYGLVCRVWRTRPFITKANQEKRRLWALAHASWTEEDWKKVIFSDESKFLLFKSDGHQYAWFKPGQALDPRFTLKAIKHGARNIMVWGCITAKGMGRLFRIEGIMCAPEYVDILKKQLGGTLKDLNIKCTGKNGYIFQQDNDPKHTSKLATEHFTKKKIKKLAWPPSSPDMSIIEHVWDQVDTLVRARDPLPTNKEQLWQALEEEWYNFPMESLQKLYESMPRRIAALVKAKGGATKY
jgi:transposase